MIDIGISKAQKIESEHHHEAMIKMTTSEKAKYWFRRKPYAAFDLRGVIYENKGYDMERLWNV